MEKVSIIIPAYNAERFLPECLDSIVQQTYSNIEIILVNDGSTDTTLKICLKYQSQDSRIKIVNQENSGVGQARNVGLNMVTGDFVEFVDSDDILPKSHVEKMVGFQHKYGAEIVACKFVFLNQKSQQLEYDTSQYFEKVYSVQEWFNHQFDSSCLFNYCFPVCYGKLFRRSLFNHIVYPKVRRSEDERTNWKIYLSCDKICFINDSLYIFRKWDNSTTAHIDADNSLPSAPLKEQIALMSMLGLDTSVQKNAYKYRLQLNTNYALQSGDYASYNNYQKEMDLFQKYQQ